MSESWGQPPQQSGGDWSVPQGGGDSGSFAPPPVDPQYGAPAPQYGAPAPQAPQPQPQPQFGGPAPQYGAPAPQYGETGQNQFGAQPQYGAPQPQFGGPVPPAGGGYGYPTEPQKNGFAIAGLILSILPLLGIIFSILGLTRAPRVGGKGRGMSIAGLILSVAFIAGYAAIGVAASNSTALDPGCRSAEDSFNSQLSTLQADENQLESNPGDTTAMNTFITEVQNLKTSLDNAEGQAQHDSVKQKIKAMDDDMTTVLTGLQAIQKGDTSQLDAFSAAAGRLESDGNAVDDICSKL